MSKFYNIENGSVRRINSYYRESDESHLWPIKGGLLTPQNALYAACEIQGYTKMGA